LTTLTFTLLGPSNTPYHNGTFTVDISIPNDYPSSPPKANFLTKIFHPNINIQTGEVCVNILKRDWEREREKGLVNILLIIKCLLIEPNYDSALNEEAAMFLRENYDEYSKRAKMMTELYAMDREAVSESESSSSSSLSLSENMGEKQAIGNSLSTKKPLTTLPLANSSLNITNKIGAKTTNNTAVPPTAAAKKKVINKRL
jgi:ubiquitin-conjugating enzyme E2 S